MGPHTNKVFAHVLAKEAGWLKAATSGADPAQWHVLNAQGMIFRMRMSNDVAFYVKVWRRICANDDLWNHVNVLVRDTYMDWRALKEGTTAGRRDTFPEKTEQRVRNLYFQEFYAGKTPDPDDQRRNLAPTVFVDETVAMPDGVSMHKHDVDPRRWDWFWAVIQTCKETMLASQRVAKAWASAAGVRLPEGDVFVAADPEEDEFFLSLAQTLVSRVIPMRWFFMISSVQRDRLLTTDAKVTMPIDDYDEWRRQVDAFREPERPPSKIIDEASRALVDAGHPGQALRLLDAYLPCMQDSDDDIAYLYHNRFLALHDMDRPLLAYQAAETFLDRARRDGDEDQIFIAELCVMQCAIRAAKHKERAFREQFARMLPRARSAQEPSSRVWRLIQLSSECDGAGFRKESEKALMAAQQAASGNPGLTQLILDHDAHRDHRAGDARPLTPPRQRGFLGTPGAPHMDSASLASLYYETYPDERPA